MATPSYRIKFTARASTELADIFDYIARKSPRNADGMIRQIRAAVDELDEMPGRYTVVGRSRAHRTPVHKMVVRPYLVYYRVDEAEHTVFVLTVRHGARRQPRTFE